jgi:hypothetical protein
MVVKNRVPSRMFWPAKEKVKGGWTILQNEELHNL